MIALIIALLYLLSFALAIRYGWDKEIKLEIPVMRVLTRRKARGGAKRGASCPELKMPGDLLQHTAVYSLIGLWVRNKNTTVGDFVHSFSDEELADLVNRFDYIVPVNRSPEENPIWASLPKNITWEEAKKKYNISGLDYFMFLAHTKLFNFYGWSLYMMLIVFLIICTFYPY
jgi:hypothetical protein